MALRPVCSGSRHRLPFGHAGGQELDRPPLGGGDRAFAVQRVAQRIEHAADHGVADRYRQQLAQRADLVPFVDLEVVAQNDDPDAVLFQVEGQPVHAVGKRDHLARHHVGQSVDVGDPVADVQHRAHFADVQLALVLLDLFLDDRGNFVSIESHRVPLRGRY